MTPEQAKSLETNLVWKAFKEGKQIQRQKTDGTWQDVGNIENGIFNAPHRYRIKPELPEYLQPGWRKLGVEEVMKEGDLIVRNMGTIVEPVKYWAGSMVGSKQSLFRDLEVYTREPLPKPKKMVPLTADDVPPGSVVRYESWQSGLYTTVLKTTTGAIVVPQVLITENGDQAGLGIISFDQLQKFWKIKRPGQDWQKCEKEEI